MCWPPPEGVWCWASMWLPARHCACAMHTATRNRPVPRCTRKWGQRKPASHGQLPVARYAGRRHSGRLERGQWVRSGIGQGACTHTPAQSLVAWPMHTDEWRAPSNRAMHHSLGGRTAHTHHCRPPQLITRHACIAGLGQTGQRPIECMPLCAGNALAGSGISALHITNANSSPPLPCNRP